MSTYNSVKEKPADVEVAVYETSDGVTVFAQADNPFESEGAYSAARTIAEGGIHNRLAALIDETKLGGQNYVDVNAQMIARLTVSRSEIKPVKLNADLLAAAIDSERIDVPVEVVHNGL